MKTRAHFTYRIDVCDDAGMSSIDHLAGIEDHKVAHATYLAARKRWPKSVIILWQGARVIEDSRRARLA
jgi:hypothetical protein